MRVLKRDGELEPVSFDKVLRRIEKFCSDLLAIDPPAVAQKVCSQIFDGVKTTELDELTARLCSSMLTDHPDYGTLASRIIISNNHKNTSPSFSESMGQLYNAKDINGAPMPLISDELWDTVQQNMSKLNTYIDYDRDYTFDFFGFKTLERSYLLRIDDKIIERPQHMFMRVALGIHKNDIKDALGTYDGMSKKLFTHATPTLFNAGTRMPSLISCFLLGMDDSIEGIFETAKRCAMISKGAGGIGIHAHAIRARGSRIHSTNGVSSGLVPFLRIFNELAKAVDQAGKRKGSIAIYLEPWHADIETFIQLRKNNGGNPEEKCLDLFTALWVPSLFFKKVQANADWCLFCPNEIGADANQSLIDSYGDDFEALYNKLEAAGKYRKKVNAQKLFMDIIKSSIETGTPYLCSKEAAQKSNQKNQGTIRSSNLCVAPETMILTEELDNCPIKDLEDVNVRVWNGEQFSNTTVRKTGTNQKLLTVTCSDGCSLRCTPYHKFYIVDDITDSTDSTNNTVVIDAKDLRPGMKLIPFKSPSTQGFTSVKANDSRYVSIAFKKNLESDEPVKIKSVEDLNEYADTYCFTEPLKNMGVFNGILTSQCAEIMEYSNGTDTVANCNLGSLVLPSYIQIDPETQKPFFNFEHLHTMVQTLTKNLNKVIDTTMYPHPSAETSNRLHRPLGIGVQGLGDTFIMMRMPFESPEAALLNKQIFETIYHAALTESMNIAKKRRALYFEMLNTDLLNNVDLAKKIRAHYTDAELVFAANNINWSGAYASFPGSPASQGILQFDMWGQPPDNSRYDWTALKTDIMEYGIRNSLLVALMPTASTSQIMGSVAEMFEPITSNIYQRRVLAGEFVIVNKYLINDLIKLGLWNNNMKNKILLGEGSVQHIQEIPADVRALYKTAYEIKQKAVLDMSAARSVYVCQSSSQNLYFAESSIDKISNAILYGWKLGLKTLVYYTRVQTKAKIASFSLDPKLIADHKASQQVLLTTNSNSTSNIDITQEAILACRRDNPEGCLMCSS